MVETSETNNILQSQGDLGVLEIYPTATLRKHDNSVDAVANNPKSDNQFATGSHDRTIKIWDAQKQQDLQTLKGHTDGVWCLNYSADGKQLLSASPDTTARLWDVRSGKSTAELKGHTARIHYAAYNHGCNAIATGGSDRLVCYWDMRKVTTPVFKNSENDSCIMSVCFIQDNEHIMSSNLEGQLSLINIQSQKRTLIHETRQGNQHSNIVYSSFALGEPKDVFDEKFFLTGDENKTIKKYRYNPRMNKIEWIGNYDGHSNSVRSMRTTPDANYMLSCCEDHSLRIWDFETHKCKALLSGHHDLVSGGVFLNKDTVVSSSWDCRVMIWKVGEAFKQA